MTDGWCPIHDRIFTTGDGLCPRCGTRLVDLVERRPENSFEDSDDASRDEPLTPVLGTGDQQSSPRVTEPHRGTLFPRSTVLALVVIVAMIAASVSVLLIRNTESPSRATGTPEASINAAPGATRQGQLGIPLRLESFFQRGRHVVIRIAVPSDLPIAIEKLERVSTAFFAAAQRYASSELVLDVRTTASGFVAEGDLDRSDATITNFRISSLTFRVPSGGDFTLDLSRVWPTTVGPRAQSLDAVATVGGRRFRLTGIVGWPDRIQARFEVSDEPVGWYYDDRYFLVIPGEAQTEGIELGSNSPSRAVRHIAFEAPPERSGRSEIKIRTRNVSIQGDWDWELRSLPAA